MFGEKLRQMRVAKGLRQSQLAAEIGVSTSAVGMYEQGRREPDRKTLMKICHFFDVTADYFLGESAVGEVRQQYSDIDELIVDLKGLLMAQHAICADGQMLTPEQRKKLGDAFEIAAAVALERRRR